MRSFSKVKTAAFAVGAALAATLAAPAIAADFNIGSANIDTTFGGLIYTVSYAGLGTAGSEDVKIGRIALQGTDSAGASVSFETYCADLLSVLHAGTFTESTSAALPFTAARVTTATTFLSHAAPLVSNVNASAAVQMGLWEILYENDSQYNVTSGAFSVSANHAFASNLANSWLANLASNDWAPIAGLNLAVLMPAAGNQAQVRIVAGTPLAAPLSAVPEPTNWAFMAIGFGLLGGFMRSQRRRTDGQLESVES